MEIKRISDYIWEIPASEKEGMLVPARIYATPLESYPIAYHPSQSHTQGLLTAYRLFL